VLPKSSGIINGINYGIVTPNGKKTKAMMINFRRNAATTSHSTEDQLQIS